MEWAILGLFVFAAVWLYLGRDASPRFIGITLFGGIGCGLVLMAVPIFFGFALLLGWIDLPLDP